MGAPFRHESFNVYELDKIKKALKALRARVLAGDEPGDANDLHDLINAVTDRIPQPPPHIQPHTPRRR